MQFDLETIRWLVSGFFLIGGSLITWLLSRQVGQIDRTLEGHDARIGRNAERINVIERDYVKAEKLDKMFELYLAPIGVKLESINKKLDKMP